MNLIITAMENNKLLDEFKMYKGYGEMRCAWSDEDVIEILAYIRLSCLNEIYEQAQGCANYTEVTVWLCREIARYECAQKIFLNESKKEDLSRDRESQRF